MDERIESRIDSIQEWMHLLNDIHGSKVREDITREAKENLLRKIVEAVIDIASRIIAVNGFKRPETYAEYFDLLNEKNIITEDLSKSLVEMAQFRNLITHQYHRIDVEELDSIIEEDLEDISKFISQVTAYQETKN
ncbi:MAG: HepT-like ribonuclease domain-containing protein [Candidatus Thermoplasmatota archaeon]